MRQALAIERRWSKDEILEAWLNLTPFRGELEGIDAASRSLFGKRAAGLDRVESALLAALVRAPNAAATRVAKRACGLLALRPSTRPPHAAGIRTRLAKAAEERIATHECLIAQGSRRAGCGGTARARSRRRGAASRAQAPASSPART